MALVRDSRIIEKRRSKRGNPNLHCNVLSTTTYICTKLSLYALLLHLKQIYYISKMIFLVASKKVRQEKRGQKRGRKSREVPGHFGPGTFRVSRSCPAPTTCPVPEPSQDFLGWDSPAGNPS